jgi:tetratricopeptide (TPR) repeat protein
MTVTDRDTRLLLRPQPVGVFEGPAALLLVGDGPDATGLLADLAGGVVPSRWPAEAAALDHALAGDAEAALAATGDDPVGAVNRFVLAPTPATLAAATLAAADDAGLLVVVATAAFAAGLSDVPPVAVGLDGELAALALTAQASAALERGDADHCISLLEQACREAETVGPALHGRLLGSLAEHLYERRGASEELVEVCDRALGVLGPTGHTGLIAGIHLQKAVVLHDLSGGERHHLVEAIRSYQSALVGLSEECDGDQFAFASMNIALAILALPMTQASDQVRLGVAVQSLRAALRVYRRDTHPAEWSAAQMNLANALQYLPSRHQEENLAEAVERYEELLAFRSRTADPAGYARVLANQANALAHLGVLDHAREKYTEARALFWTAGDPDAVGVVDAQLRQIDDPGGGAA